VRVQEEARSTPCRVVEATEPRANGSVGGQEPIVPHTPLGLVRTPDEPATPNQTLHNDVVDSLKQVVDKINIIVDKVDKTARVCVVPHPISWVTGLMKPCSFAIMQTLHG
jgi:hypothetical protein